MTVAGISPHERTSSRKKSWYRVGGNHKDIGSLPSRALLRLCQKVTDGERDSGRPSFTGFSIGLKSNAAKHVKNVDVMRFGSGFDSRHLQYQFMGE